MMTESTDDPSKNIYGAGSGGGNWRCLNCGSNVLVTIGDNGETRCSTCGAAVHLRHLKNSPTREKCSIFRLGTDTHICASMVAIVFALTILNLIISAASVPSPRDSVLHSFDDRISALERRAAEAAGKANEH